MSLADDLILNAADEVTIRQHLLLASLWVPVASSELAPNGFVSGQTGETNPVVG